MSRQDPGFHGLCSGCGAAALCVWREAILLGCSGGSRPPVRIPSQGGPCACHLSLSSNLISSLLIVSEPCTCCQGWTGPWAPLVARCGLALQGLGPGPRGVQMQSDPTEGVSAGVQSAPRARRGQHLALGSREASWRREHLSGCLEERADQTGRDSFLGRGQRPWQRHRGGSRGGLAGLGCRWGAPDALTLPGSSDCPGTDRFITGSVCVYRGAAVSPAGMGEIKPP